MLVDILKNCLKDFRNVLLKPRDKNREHNAWDMYKHAQNKPDPVAYLEAANQAIHEEDRKTFQICLEEAAFWYEKQGMFGAQKLKWLAKHPQLTYELAFCYMIRQETIRKRLF